MCPGASTAALEPRVPDPRLSPYHHTHCLSHRVLSSSGFLRAPSKPHPCFPRSSTPPAGASPGRWFLVRKTLAEGRHLVVILVPCSRCQASLPPSQAERELRGSEAGQRHRGHRGLHRGRGRDLHNQGGSRELLEILDKALKRGCLVGCSIDVSRWLAASQALF